METKGKEEMGSKSRAREGSAYSQERGSVVLSERILTFQIFLNKKQLKCIKCVYKILTQHK